MASIRTNDGRLVDPFNPKPGDVRPRVFCHALSTINRFTGQANWPYSVGQHTINLYRIVPRPLRKAAIVHDFAEAWFNDLAAPVKHECDDYKEAEEKAKFFIANELGVSGNELECFDIYDKQIYINERDALFDSVSETGMGDDRQGLFDPLGMMTFQERPWKDVRAELMWAFVNEFGTEVFAR